MRFHFFPWQSLSGVDSTHQPTSDRRICAASVCVGLWWFVVACSPSSLVDTQSPSTVVDPAVAQTASGAASMRNSALSTVRIVFAGNLAGVVALSGTVTDELQDPGYQGCSGDDRMLAASSCNHGSPGYDLISRARVFTRQARQALQQWAPNSSSTPRAWQGELYAIEGYTVLWFAELYCSGIPLSQSSLDGTQLPARGSSTAELFAAAIALFDSAASVGADSARFVYLAHVGKGRAFLGLGKFAEADSAVADVPLSFVYTLPPVVGYDITSTDIPAGNLRVQDHEGGNGLVWSTDPRVAVVTVDSLTGTMLWPAKYNINAGAGTPDPTTPTSGVAFRLADGLEAQLIHAEAALARGDAAWLAVLNTLRATCVGTAACAPRLGLASGVLPPLTDPGTPDARIDTLMKERAMWLYLTGHREGDLRRMARVYGRDKNTLWPTGVMSEPAYPPMFPGVGKENGQLYGNDVVYTPDPNEQIFNSQYGGCYDHNP